MLSEYGNLLVNPSSLDQTRQFLIHTHIPKLNDYLLFFYPRGTVAEWGAPHGKFSRLIPALVVQSLNEPSLWISNRTDLNFYPTSWFDIGFDLSKLHFTRYENSLKIIRTAIEEDNYKNIIIDSCEFLSPAELNYLHKAAKRKNISIFLIRHFFLTNRNGNPFCKYRFNSEFSLKENCFKIFSVKGLPTKQLTLDLYEVFDG